MEEVKAKFSDFMHHAYSSPNVQEVDDAPYKLQMNNVNSMMQEIEEDLFDDSNRHESERHFKTKEIRKEKSDQPQELRYTIPSLPIPAHPEKRRSQPLIISDMASSST